MKALTDLEFKRRFNDRFGDKFTCLDTYINNITKLRFRCQEGHIFEREPGVQLNKKNNHGCPQCKGFYQSIKLLQYHATSLNGKLISTVYNNVKDNYDWECDEGHIWVASWDNVKRGKWCPHCVGRRQNINDLYEYANKKGGACLSDKYNRSDDYYKWKCSNGHEWVAMWDNVKAGSWCPVCKSSRGESKLMEVFNELRIDYIPQMKFDNLKLVRHLPFDFYLNDYNIVIEYDGEQHFKAREKGWCTDDMVENNKKKDTIKTKFCFNNNIKLIRIPYTLFDDIEFIISREYLKGFPRSINYSKRLL